MFHQTDSWLQNYDGCLLRWHPPAGSGARAVQVYQTGLLPAGSDARAVHQAGRPAVSGATIAYEPNISRQEESGLLFVVQNIIALQDLVVPGNIVQNFIVQENMNSVVHLSLLTRVSDEKIKDSCLVHFQIELRGKALMEFEKSDNYSIRVTSSIKDKSCAANENKCQREEVFQLKQGIRQHIHLFQLASQADLKTFACEKCIVEFQVFF